MTVSLPNFVNPPVVEVVLCLQFEALKNLHNYHVGLLWSDYKSEFPDVEEHEILGQVIENLADGVKGRPSLQLKLMNQPVMPRFWFKNNKDDKSLIQIQNNRFVHNWRKADGDHNYPRYETLKLEFCRHLETFADFLKRYDIGELKPIQCEVTYVNHISSDTCPDLHSNPHKFFSFLAENYTKTLPKQEDITIGVRYKMPNADNPVGRFHVDLQPAVDDENNSQVYVLTLTGRGKPEEPTIESALKFMDTTRDWVVNGFVDITTSEAHKLWGKQ